MSNMPLAEVVESYLDYYIAQAWKLDVAPLFGALVRVQFKDYIVFGVVSAIQSGPQDQARSVFVYQKTELELKADHPQVFALLKTIFTVNIIGYKKVYAVDFIYTLSPHPCSLHSFVSEATIDEIQTFFQCPDFLHVLFGQVKNIDNIDELLLAIVQYGCSKGVFDNKNYYDLFELYSMLIGNDYKRVKLFLHRAQQFLAK